MKNTKNIFKSWLFFYIVYWFMLIGWFVWIIYEPKTFKIICFVIALTLQIFNSTKVKKMKQQANLEMKMEILERLD